jgi:P-type Cu+ transporter
MATDPVCGMFVEEGPTALRLVRDNRTYYFCCESCRDQFADPEAAQRRLARRIAVAWPVSVVVALLIYAVGTRDALLAAAGLATVVQFYAGLPFYVGTRDAIRDRSWNMDVLIAVGSTTAYAYSLAVLLVPVPLIGGTYFDASSLIITLILTGNYLEHLARARTGSALLRLQELLPTTATVVRDGVERSTPVAEIRPGDRIRVRAGGRVPADGIVRAGSTSTDESLLTGEPLPVAKGVGDPVIAASIITDGYIEMEATAVGSDTFLAQVGRLVSDAEMSRVPLQRTADRIASVFVPVVLVLGLLAAAAWVALGGASPSTGLLVFVSVVIIACPCAFGLATPAALVAGAGRAAEDGILFRGEDSIERAATVDLVVTDKTGTLTTGHPSLTDVRSFAGISEEELLTLAAAVEVGSDHPLARSVREAAAQRGVRVASAEAIRGDAGHGVAGTVEGRVVAIVRPADVRSWSREEAATADALEALGRSVSVVLRESVAVGVLGFSDPVRDGIAAAVASLHQDGVEVVMATGDLPGPAATVARSVGIRDVRAGLTPAGKLELVRATVAGGRHVAFVGDGVNDAPALAAADLGVAIGSGTAVAREAGQVVLVRSDFRAVALGLRIARRTVAKVRGNLVWALGYNAVLLPVAAGALIPVAGFGIYRFLPIAGALAMAMSSTLVVLNSLSLRWVSLAR